MSTAPTGDHATLQRADRSTFVGRARELAALNTALTQTTARNGRVVMLVGEAGIGKTRTAAEFATHARAVGALVLRGACYEKEWAPPYGPFVEALTTYIRQSDPASLREELGFGPAPLARLLPCKHTLASPADSPKIVTLFGSPENAAMLRSTHSSAAALVFDAIVVNRRRSLTPFGVQS